MKPPDRARASKGAKHGSVLPDAIRGTRRPSSSCAKHKPHRSFRQCCSVVCHSSMARLRAGMPETRACQGMRLHLHASQNLLLSRIHDRQAVSVNR